MVFLGRGSLFNTRQEYRAFTWLERCYDLSFQIMEDAHSNRDMITMQRAARVNVLAGSLLVNPTDTWLTIQFYVIWNELYNLCNKKES